MTPGLARALVFARDGYQCVVPALALRFNRPAGPCYDKYGRLFSGYDPTGVNLEPDRVRDAPSMGKAPSHSDPTRMLTACPGHHRGVGPNGGRQWCTANRDVMRQRLDELYPERR